MNQELKGSQVSPLVRALTERELYIPLKLSMLMQEAGHEPFIEDIDAHKEKVTLRYHKIISVDGNPSISKAINLGSLYGSTRRKIDQTYAELFHEDNKVSLVTDEQKETLAETFANSLSKNFLDAQPLDILRQIDRAKEIAKEKSVEPVEVFIKDDLYYELIKKTYTKFEYATMMVKFLDLMDPRNLAGVVADATLKIMKENDPAIMLSTALLPSMREVVIDTIIAAPETAEAFKKANDLKRISIHVMSEQIKRFWGTDAIETLPPYLQEEFIEDTKF